MPDSVRSVLCPDDPITIVVWLSVVKQVIDVFLHGFFARTVSALSPVTEGANVLEGIAGKVRPALADLHNMAVLIMDDDREWKFANRAIEEAVDLVFSLRRLRSDDTSVFLLHYMPCRIVRSVRRFGGFGFSQRFSAILFGSFGNPSSSILHPSIGPQSRGAFFYLAD